MKICFACSSGGHLAHLYMLRPFWQEQERFWVTFDKEDARSLLEGERLIPCFYPTNRSLKALIRNTRLAWKVLREEKPDVIISTGADPKNLGLPGEQNLVGRGISHCAACDGMFYKGKTVAIVGGGNTAAADALQLSRICEKVIVIHRRDTLRATKIYHQPLMDAPNVEFLWNSAVTQLLSDGRLTGLRVQNLQTGEESTLECDGLFVSIGRHPNTALVQGQLELDSAGYILADESTRTSLPGVFAAGDVRTKELRQVITAAADGASAAHYAETYLASLS